jgi:hypothetical protein
MAKSKGRAATFAVIARQRANEPRERLRNSAAAGGGQNEFRPLDVKCPRKLFVKF